VVEVGIDVPNATVMVIEGADRFGLAQLHQFRGRVGRGEHPSYCYLLADDPSAEAEERLSIMERTRDGFELAEADLQLRGPGDLFGTAQSGASQPPRRLAPGRPAHRRRPPRGRATARRRPRPHARRPTAPSATPWPSVRPRWWGGALA
jgi:ATP-dependent DNA helicase RecG